MTRLEIQPIGNWTDPVTKGRASQYRFRATWTDTLDLLIGEAEQLGATLVVLQVDCAPGDIRRDGMLYAKARVGFPGVRVSFDSRHGPLTYATDAYETWQANVRALALALQALRAVDRYGVTRRGQQYTGWLAIEARPDQALAEAVALLDSYGGERRALHATHPDTASAFDPEKFDAVQRARALLASRATAGASS